MKTLQQLLLAFSLSLLFSATGCTLDHYAHLPEVIKSEKETVVAEIAIPTVDTSYLEKASRTATKKFVIPRYDATTVQVFSRLAKDTGGEAYFSDRSAHVADVLTRLLCKHAEEKADVVFLIDNTGSMLDDILGIQAAANQILDVLEGLPRVRVGVACYGDKHADGASWYSQHKLSANFDHARQAIAQIKLNDGGDQPESVYDGLMETFQRYHWDDGKRMVLVLGDAPPLDGSLSAYQYEDVVRNAKSQGIEANLFPVIINQYAPEEASISMVD